MTTLLPDLIVCQSFVWQASQTEASISDADPASIVGKDLCSDVDQAALLRLDHLACLHSAMNEDQLARPVIRVLCHVPIPKRVGPWRRCIHHVNGGITPEASRRVFGV